MIRHSTASRIRSRFVLSRVQTTAVRGMGCGWKKYGQRPDRRGHRLERLSTLGDGKLPSTLIMIAMTRTPR